jgi:hypothetical protein
MDTERTHIDEGDLVSASSSTPLYVRALYDFKSADSAALQLRRHDIIEVVCKLDSGWWEGRRDGRQGWFPSNYVEPVEPGIPGKVYVDEDSTADMNEEGEEDINTEFSQSTTTLAATIGTSPSIYPTTSSLNVLAVPPTDDDVSSTTMIPSENNMPQVILVNDDEDISRYNGPVLRISQVPDNAWLPRETEHGYVYFYNVKTHETVWELPEGARAFTVEDALALIAAERERQQTVNDNGKDNIDAPLSHGATISTASTIGLSNTTGMKMQETDSEASSLRQHRRQISTSTTTTFRSTTESIAKSTYPLPANPNEEVPDNQLPPYWGKKRTPSGRVYYFNMLTDHTTWSLHTVDLETGLPLVNPSASKRQVNSDFSEAPHFTVNALARTSSTSSVATLDSFNDHASILLANYPDLSNPGESRQRGRKPSGFVGKLSDLHSYQASMNGQGRDLGRHVEVNWPRLVALIVLAIHRLNHSAKHGSKSAYIADSSMIVDAIRAMLLASGTVERDAPVIKAHSLLKAHHCHIMNALSKLVLSAKDASRVWPPPDAVQQMQANASEVLLAARHFMSTAQDLGITVQPVDGVDLDALEMELSGSVSTTVGYQQHGHKRSVSSAGLSSEQLYADQPAASVDLLIRFSQSSDLALTAITNMIQCLQQLSIDMNQQQQQPNYVLSTIPADAINYAKNVVRMTEQFLLLIHDLCRDAVSDEAAERLQDARAKLQAEVTHFVMLMQLATDKSVGMMALDMLMKCIHSVDTATKDLLVAAKLQVEERDALEHRALEGDLDRFRALQRKDEYSEIPLRIRRALSMSHIGTEEMKKTLLAGATYANMVGDEEPVASYSPTTANHVQSRSMHRMRTDPGLHMHAASAAVKSVAQRTQPVTEESPYLYSDSIYSIGDDVGIKYKSYADSISNYPDGVSERVKFDDTKTIIEDSASAYTYVDSTADQLYKNVPKETLNMIAPWNSLVPGQSSTTKATSPTSNVTSTTTATTSTPGHIGTNSTGIMAGVNDSSVTLTSGSGNVAATPTTPSNTTGIIETTSDKLHKLTKVLGDDLTMDAVNAAASGTQDNNNTSLTSPSKSSAEETPHFLGYDYGPDEIVFTADSNVKGGTMAALVERCTLHDSLDPTFINNFLLTYRSFSNSDELMDLLFKRFQVQPPPGLTPEELEIWRNRKQIPIQFRVFNIIKQWLESVYQESDIEVLKKLRAFVESTMSIPLTNTAPLLKLIEKREKKATEATLRKLVRNLKQETPPPIMPKRMDRLRFIDIDPLELARQLTIRDSQQFSKIMPIECINKAWSNKKSSQASNIRAMIDSSNQLTHWVIEMILQENDVRKRAQLIRHCVAVAEVSESMMCVYMHHLLIYYQ